MELNLPPRLACQFLSAPAIPRAQVAEVSRRLGQALPERHHGLLPGTPAPAVGIDEDPVLILRLQRGHVNTGGYYYGYRHEVDHPIGVAHLSFRYGPIEIENFGAGEPAGSLPRRTGLFDRAPPGQGEGGA